MTRLIREASEMGGAPPLPRSGGRRPPRSGSLYAWRHLCLSAFPGAKRRSLTGDRRASFGDGEGRKLPFLVKSMRATRGPYARDPTFWDARETSKEAVGSERRPSKPRAIRSRTDELAFPRNHQGSQRTRRAAAWMPPGSRPARQEAARSRRAASFSERGPCGGGASREACAAARAGSGPAFASEGGRSGPWAELARQAGRDAPRSGRGRVRGRTPRITTCEGQRATRPQGLPAADGCRVFCERGRPNAALMARGFEPRPCGCPKSNVLRTLAA